MGLTGEGPAGGDGKLVAIRVEQPVEETVKLLEDLLERARAGEVLQIMGIVLERETVVRPVMTGGIEVREATYGLRLLTIHVDALIKALGE